MRLKKIILLATSVIGLMAGGIVTPAETAVVDGMSCTYTLNRSVSTAIALTKVVPANSRFISVEVKGFAYNKNGEIVVTRDYKSSYAGEMELSVKVTSSTYGYHFFKAESIHCVNSWTAMLNK